MDNGILSLFLMDPETSLLENLVAVTLKKRYGDGLCFYHRNIEVDFDLDEAKSTNYDKCHFPTEHFCQNRNGRGAINAPIDAPALKIEVA